MVDTKLITPCTSDRRGPYVDCDSPCTTSVWITKAAGGCIVNVASMAGLNSNPFSPVYGCTKAGIIHVTRCYAVSEAAKKSNIRLNVLCPAFVDTPMFRRMAERTLPRLSAGTRQR
ncbi:15-hydroxyprostaglandin dehydrogenase [NAD(+)]-like isoform X1 [Dreissena polymorpha]|uniref:15-hydroxyprostaglandin dehydrogenase [NAD(+)]-like isoform X1 n=1 Tax=Dreissena polymorpha TaxID=45954 RepID=UPI0022640BC4|nr:15-hydroxyprostaglandin dehydrogenase [NAD(+)]-like isoform X1 [Dreissena polymorpha]